MVGFAPLLLALMQPSADFQLKTPDKDWLLLNSPHGFDMTPDGSVWMNVNPVGWEDDYSVLATDLYKVRGQQSRRVWIRGYHRRNPDVRYRESKQLVTIDCLKNEISTSQRHYYMQGGAVSSDVRYVWSREIIPGAWEARWRDFVCAVT